MGHVITLLVHLDVPHYEEGSRVVYLVLFFCSINLYRHLESYILRKDQYHSITSKK